MSKKTLRPINGNSLIDLLANNDNLNISAEVRSRLGINVLCVDRKQGLAFTRDLLRMNSKANKRGLTEVGTMEDAAMELLRTWVPLARLECKDCLNAECRYRDPEVPVPSGSTRPL